MPDPPLAGADSLSFHYGEFVNKVNGHKKAFPSDRTSFVSLFSCSFSSFCRSVSRSHVFPSSALCVSRGSSSWDPLVSDFLFSQTFVFGGGAGTIVCDQGSYKQLKVTYKNIEKAEMRMVRWMLKCYDLFVFLINFKTATVCTIFSLMLLSLIIVYNVLSLYIQ